MSNMPSPQLAEENAEALPLGPVVGIGASAGGLEALRTFFSNLPEDPGLSFVVIQHLSPDHQSSLAELLASTTKMPVCQLTGPMPALPNQVCVAAPNTVVSIKHGMLIPTSAPDQPGHRLPIDFFLRSLALELRENAVGVILSGAGNDGTLGLQAIRRLGGLTLVQSPETCRFDAMPKAAISAGVADHVLKVEEMGAQLTSYFAFRAQQAEGNGDSDELITALPVIFRLLHESLGHDFSRYKQSTLIRRIRRRMQMLRIKPVDAYADVLGKDPKEAEQLFRDLIIGVTEFFRDTEAFDCLAQSVIPKLFEQLDPSGTLRIWVAGCATGEEAYSIAMLLQEYMGQTGEFHPVQIFATDIDADAIETARQGFYKEEIREQVSPERLARFFQAREGGFQIQKDIREMCVFSVHNLVHDPPFSRMDFVACRNVLIYFDATLQQRVLPLFLYALNSRGFLFLGPAESLGIHAGLFHPIEKKLRIFQVKLSASVPAVRLPRPDGGRSNRIVGDTTLKVKLARERDHRELHEQALLDWYIPPSVLIDANGEVLHFVRQTARFLQPPVGSPSNNIFDIVKDDLRIVMRAALSQARKDAVEVIKKNIPVGDAGERISLVVRPLATGENIVERFLVLFRDEPSIPSADSGPAHSRAEEVEAVQQLEKELRVTKQWLQTTVEELENSNEELKSSNEELISINEEYQSANEALQTSKEEFQSLNEELETVNAELSKKVDELDHANADMRSLFASTGIATIFLDGQMRIKRFTPAACELFSLIDSDIGRVLDDIAARFEVSAVLESTRQAVAGQAVPEIEIHIPEAGRQYVCRASPAITGGDKAAGAVLNFIDITALKLAQAALQDSARRKDEFLAVLGHELRNPLVPLKMGMELLGHLEAPGEQAAEIYAMFRRQVDHLTKIVDELLDVSRISKGVISLSREPLDLRALAASILDDYQRVFGSASLILTAELGDEPAWIDGDRTRLGQILSNLLNNSAKFTPAGGRVTVSLRTGNSQVQLAVQDTGRGLDEKTLPQLFLPFSQGAKNPAHPHAGLGLGLALVKGLSELHGGSVSATSSGPGQGATFTVTLPLSHDRPSAAAPPSPRPAKSRRIVLIEDNPDAARSLALVLGSFGHVVTAAEDGLSGITMVRETDPEIVICDIGLPGELDGFAVAQQLRTLPGRRRLLVALTGYGQEQDRQKALAAGFDRHCTKPLSAARIQEILSSLD